MHAKLFFIQLYRIHKTWIGQLTLSPTGKHHGKHGHHGTGNLSYATCMTSPFKFRGEKRIHHLQSRFLRNETRRNAQHVGIVVLPTQGCNLWGPRDAGAHIVVLVGSHGHAVGRTTYQNAQSGMFPSHILRHRVGMVWIIHTIRCVCTTVQHGMALGFEVLCDSGLQFRSRVIASNADNHVTKIPTVAVHEPVGSEEELFLERERFVSKPDARVPLQIFYRRFSHVLSPEIIVVLHNEVSCNFCPRPLVHNVCKTVHTHFGSAI